MAQTQTRARPQQRQPTPQAPPHGQALAVVGAPRWPLPVAEAQALGIGMLQWRNATEDYWPNAKSAEGIVRALAFCKDHDLDPGKRVCHVVPIWSEKKSRLVDTIWPSIAAVRMIATRTGLYVRTEPCVYGPDQKATLGDLEISYPQWAQITVVRLDANGNEQPIAGPRLMWREYYATKKDTLAPNAMWRKKPYFMLEKCAEAAALRRGFPENIGNTYIVDESHQWGAIIDVTPAEAPPRPRRADFTAPPDRGEPLCEIIDLDGEVSEFWDAEEARTALVRVFEAAYQRDNRLQPSERRWLKIAAENNPPSALPDTHRKELIDLHRRLIADLDPFGLKPVDAKEEEPNSAQAAPDHSPASVAGDTAAGECPSQGTGYQVGTADFDALEPKPSSLLGDEGGIDWDAFTDSFLAMIARASPADARAYQTARNPHLQKMRTTAGDDFRRIMTALTARAKAVS